MPTHHADVDLVRARVCKESLGDAQDWVLGRQLDAGEPAGSSQRSRRAGHAALASQQLAQAAPQQRGGHGCWCGVGSSSESKGGVTPGPVVRVRPPLAPCFAPNGSDGGFRSGGRQGKKRSRPEPQSPQLLALHARRAASQKPRQVAFDSLARLPLPEHTLALQPCSQAALLGAFHAPPSTALTEHPTSRAPAAQPARPDGSAAAAVAREPVRQERRGAAGAQPGDR